MAGSCRRKSDGSNTYIEKNNTTASSILYVEKLVFHFSIKLLLDKVSVQPSRGGGARATPLTLPLFYASITNPKKRRQ
jgi:hypothetical protein